MLRNSKIIYFTELFIVHMISRGKNGIGQHNFFFILQSQITLQKFFAETFYNN